MQNKELNELYIMLNLIKIKLLPTTATFFFIALSPIINDF